MDYSQHLFYSIKPNIGIRNLVDQYEIYHLGHFVLKKCKGSIMSVCRKCNNTNVTWDGVWKQCASCGEVHERQSVMESNKISCRLLSNENKSVKDIVSLPLKSTLMGKLISRLHLIH